MALIAKYSIDNNSEYQPIQKQDTKENDIQRHRDYYQQEQKDTGDHFKGCAEIPQMEMTDMPMMFHRLSGHKSHLLPLKLIQTKPSIFEEKFSSKKIKRRRVTQTLYLYIWLMENFFQYLKCNKIFECVESSVGNKILQRVMRTEPQQRSIYIQLMNPNGKQ